MNAQRSRRRAVGASSKNRPPTYQELADLVCELVETNIANLETERDRFVRCFTYSGGNAPDDWHRALAAREALIENKLEARQIRTVDRAKIRSMRPRGGGR